jgi:hypothetical protein
LLWLLQGLAEGVEFLVDEVAGSFDREVYTVDGGVASVDCAECVVDIDIAKSGE